MSFTLAGEELAMTQSGVSKQIKGLEDFLGVSLFIRERHQLHLTDAGRIFHLRCAQALDNLQLAVTEIKDNQNQLKLQVPPTLAARWLMPQINLLHEELPGIDLHIETTWLRKISDQISAEDNELIIHACKNYPFNNVHQDPLRQEILAVVVSPGYIAKHGPINKKEDLLTCDLIHTRLDGHIHWEAWSRMMGFDALDTSQGYEFETLDMAISAAENSIGVVVCDLLYALNSLQTGRLIIPFTMPLFRGLNYVLLNHQNQSNQDSSRYNTTHKQFRHWLKTLIHRDEQQLIEYLEPQGFSTKELQASFTDPT